MFNLMFMCGDLTITTHVISTIGEAPQIGDIISFCEPSLIISPNLVDVLLKVDERLIAYDKRIMGLPGTSTILVNCSFVKGEPNG